MGNYYTQFTLALSKDEPKASTEREHGGPKKEILRGHALARVEIAHERAEGV